MAWLLRGRPDDPEQESWGGRFVRAWERPRATFDWLTNADDRFEQFSIVELTLPVGPIAPSEPFATMEIENQSLVGDFESEGSVRLHTPEQHCVPRRTERRDDIVRTASRQWPTTVKAASELVDRRSSTSQKSNT